MNNSIIKNEKIVIYDFCQTLVSFETADEFVRFVLNEYKSKNAKRIEFIRCFLEKSRLIRVIDKIFFKLNKGSFNKKLLLRELSGCSRGTIEKYANLFYQKRIKNHLINPILESLICYKNQGYKVAIVSASYEPIIVPFVKEYNIDYLVTNKLHFVNDVFSGKIIGNDCIGVNKVYYFKNAIKSDYTVYASFGDSLSDLPILQIAQKSYVVSKNKSKSWASRNNIREIIWKSEEC